jgi:hypothetical protein
MWTHLIGGRLAVDSMVNGKWRKELLGHEEALSLGCQAPDMFYYCNFQPWKWDKMPNLISAAIHLERCRDFAVALVDALDQGRETFAQDLAFVLGCLSHWVLDRVTHPYIHYISGFGLKPQASSVRGPSLHKRIELYIDVWLADKYLGVKPYRESLMERLHLGLEIPQSLAVVLGRAIAHTYPTLWLAQSDDCVKRCYGDLFKSLNWLYDPRGHKQRFFWGVLDKILGWTSVDYFYPRDSQATVDYLNESHQQWRHPCDESEVSTASFHDLFERAVAETRELMDNTVAYLGKDLSREAWIESLGNLSYSTGKDCSLPATLTYSQPISLGRKA